MGIVPVFHKCSAQLISLVNNFVDKTVKICERRCIGGHFFRAFSPEMCIYAYQDYFTISINQFIQGTLIHNVIQ